MADAMNLLDIAMVQARLRWRDPVTNRKHLGQLMDQSTGADLYLLPETFSTGFLGDSETAPETMSGESVAWMVEQAVDRKAAIAGSLALLDDAGKRRNRFLFVTAEGILAYYDKRHLFGFGGEDERYSAGRTPCTFEWRGWKIDLQVCYDLRFPVWCRNSRGFDLQLFVANWPSPRVLAWQSLLRARAIENQSYVIGINCSGVDGNDIDYPGCSSAWSGMGECLVELDQREQVSRVTLDRDKLHELRRKFPFLKDADRFVID